MYYVTKPSLIKLQFDPSKVETNFEIEIQDQV